MNETWEQRQAMARQQAQQYSDIVARQKQPWNTGGNMYVGGDPSFNERTGQPYGDYFPEPRGGDNYLQMLMNKYGSAARGAYGEASDWMGGRMPNANREYMDARHRFVQNGMGDQ